MSIDLLIGGAGLAGLRIGLAALRANRKQRVVILEKELHTGGRVFTYYSSDPVPIQWEEGAGRISTQHKKTLSLLKTYGLHTIPISSTSNVLLCRDVPAQPTPNPFDDLSAIYLDPLRALDSHMLATHTIEQLLKKTVGPAHTSRILSLFPYYAETHTLRADLALQSFTEEMGRSHHFVVCQEGLSALTSTMAAEFLERGGEIHHGITITKCVPNRQGMQVNITHSHNHTQYRGAYDAHAVVLTMPCDALKKIMSVPVLRHLGMEPLVRIYAVFPLQNGKAWFDDQKIVTDGVLRYIIPMNPKKGTIMISYTEGPDALHWSRLSKKDMIVSLMAAVRALFPDRHIPDPRLLLDIAH